MVNLEGTLTDGGASKCGAGSSNCFAFRSPPSYAATFRKAGIDVVNQANNHAFDYGASGYADTRRAVRGAGLKSTGGPDDVTVVRHDGVRVAFVGFASYPWSGPLNDPAGVRSLIGKAKDRADLVVVAFHGGAEGSGAQHVPSGDETYLGEDRGDLRCFARTAVDAGADLVVGSGPHVVRGMEFYKGHLIAYSAGNFVGYGGVFGLAGPTAVSYILNVTLRSDGRFRVGPDDPHAAERIGHRGTRFLGSGDRPGALAHRGRFPLHRGPNCKKRRDPATCVVICDRRSIWPAVKERTSVWFAGTCTSSVRDREVPKWLPEP